MQNTLVTGLRRSWEAVLVLVDGLSPEDWTRPSPLELWTVGDLVAHLAHVEGMSHGFPQPSPPPDWSFDGPPLHVATNAGVTARRGKASEEVLAELHGAATATLELISSLEEADLDRPAPTVVGEQTLERALELRNGDVYVHYLDLLVALDRYSPERRIPEAEAALVARVVRLSGWAAVKQASLEEGTRVRLELTGPGAVTTDVLVTGGRGLLVAPEGTPHGRVAGPGISYALVAGGRDHPHELISALAVEDAARRLVRSFGLFG